MESTESESLIKSSEQNLEESHHSYKLEEFTKEELIEKCNKFLALAKNAKKSKDEIMRQNELMKRELKELRGENYDLELQNQILKRDRIYQKDEDVNLLSELPIMRTADDNRLDNQRLGCFWRLGTFFRG